MASIYTAVLLTEESRQNLIAFYGLTSFYAEGWVIKAHHMTIDTKSAEKAGVADLVGKEFAMDVTAIGRLMVDDTRGIVAVTVETAAPSKNAIKHVTVALAEGFKPMLSNNITDWRPVKPGTLTLTGVVCMLESAPAPVKS